MWSSFRAAAVGFLSFLLQMCGTDVVLHCMPTRDGNGMLYRVLNPSYPSGAQCDYWWNNGSTVLATNNNKTTLVMRHNSSSLETSECLSNVSWILECSQMQLLRDYSANCSTSCASKNTLHGDNPTPDSTYKAIIGLMVSLVLLGLIVFLLIRYKERISWLRNCNLTGRLYSAVRRENDDSGQTNV
ncbi:uncharacterized protein FYW61_014412 [Anableps anableps]